MGIKQKHGPRALTGRKNRHVSVENEFVGSDKFSDLAFTQAFAPYSSDYMFESKALSFFTHESRLIHEACVGFVVAAQHQPPILGPRNGITQICHNSSLQISDSFAADHAVNGWLRGGREKKDVDRDAACVLSFQTRFLIRPS
jgi:hypothetical protein